MPSKVYVVGVGMTKFEKPGSRDNFDYPDMAKESGQKALQDAGISFDKIEQAFVGYVYGDSTCGQRAVYELGITGIPIVNVNNNCATGSTALLMAKNAIEGGLANCVLALGFEKMQRGSLSSQYSDRCNPMEKHVELMSNLYEITGSPMTAQMFGNAGRDYIKKYNLDPNDDVFARIAHKNHKHSVNNPYAQFQKEYTLDEIKNSTVIYEPLTKLQCSPTSDGSAAAVLASEDFVKKNGLESKAVEIVALEMATDLPSSFSNPDCMKIVGFDMSQMAAQKAFQKAAISPKDVQVIELHDCFSCNELITYEALGLCDPGKAVDLVKQNQNTFGGKYVVNPSGGLISKGHPLGATGIAQCAELSWQLRGLADKRQVENVKYGLQHNIGLGGAAVVGIYRLGFPQSIAPSSGLPKTTSLKSLAFFEQVEAQLNVDGKSMVNKIGSIIGFNVACQDKTVSYVIDLKNGNGSVKINDGSVKPDCTISIADDDLAKIVQGKLNMMSAFTQKKLKISGNMSVAMKLNQVFSSVAKKSEVKSTPKEEESGTKTNPASASSELSKMTMKHKSGQFFDEVQLKMKQEGPGYVSKVNAIIGFTITDCPSNETISYILNLKNPPGSISVNDGSTKADVTITIKDSDMLDILGGKLNMMSAFTKKKLKISGNMSVAMKLNQIFSAVLKTRSKL